MAITFVGSHVGTHAAVSGQAVAFTNLRNEANAQPTLQQGDLVLVAVENASTVDRTQAELTPSGYTAAHTDDYRNDSNDSNFLVSYKVMGSTPDTSVTIPASNATTAGVAYAIYVFRGVNTVGGPFDATPVVTGNINTGVANANAITPVTDGAWIVVFGGAAVAAGAVFTNPAGMSTTTNHFRSATITSTTNDANIGGAIYTGWTSGSYDPAAFGGSTSTNTGSWSAVTLALLPYFEPITGTLAATETGADTFAATGTVADPSVTGTLAASETGSDTFAGSGTIPITGTLAATETGADAASMAGNVPIAGALSAAESGNDAAAGSGSVSVTGTLGAAETGADTFAASGTVGSSGVSGTMAASESGSDSFAGTGAVAVSGTFAGLEAANDNFSGTGTTGSGLTGTMAATETGQDYLDGWNLWRWVRPAPRSWGLEAEPAGEWALIPPANGTWG